MTQYLFGIIKVLQLHLSLLTVYYKVSEKGMCQLALNSLKNQKREKSISDLLVMALPERVVAGLSTSSSSSMKARMTSLDSSLSPESMSFSFFSSLLLSLSPLPSSSLSSLTLSNKGYFQLRLFLSILFVTDQFLQDSFGEASVW